MPEIGDRHPTRTIQGDGSTPNPLTDYIERGVVTCFSFLRGAFDVVDLAATANALGFDKIGCADLNTMAGVVRLHTQARKAQIKPLIGCCLLLVAVNRPLHIRVIGLHMDFVSCVPKEKYKMFLARGRQTATATSLWMIWPPTPQTCS